MSQGAGLSGIGELLLAAVEHIADVVMVTDADANILYVNPGFERVTGFSREEALGRNPRIMQSGMHSPEFYRAMWETLLSGRVWKGTMRNRHKNGQIYTEEATIAPVRAPSGVVTHYVSVKRDVTAQLLLEQQYRQAQKMETVGNLASGIAHDFNNLLTAILGYTEMAQGELEEDSRLRKDLRSVVNAAQKARDLVRHMQSFSRETEGERSEVHLSNVLDEALHMLEAGKPKLVSLVKEIDPDCGTVLANGNQLQQVLMNLCTNAYQAMPNGKGQIVVRLSHVHLNPERAAATPGLHEGAYILLSVEDDGAGIPNEDLPRLFEPFFTTKPDGVGTGLGLPMVQKIVLAHGGVITVESELGRGTRFDIYLPKTVEPEVKTKKEAPSIPGGSERVLVVDDDEQMTTLMARRLEQLGYSVVRCTQPEDAMLILRKHPNIFQVVLTDQVMPGITGMEIAAEVHGIREDLPVILCTGMAASLDKAEMDRCHVAALMHKPVNTVTLAETLRRVLDAQVN